MDVLRAFLISTGLATALAALCLTVLYRPFRTLLAELCASESHGRFWHAFAWIAVLLTTLLAAFLQTRDPELWGGSEAVRIALSAFRSGLLGLLLALGAVALALLVSIGQRPRGDTRA